MLIKEDENSKRIRELKELRQLERIKKWEESRDRHV